MLKMRDFECGACHATFEALCADGESVLCPTCGEQDCARVASNFRTFGTIVPTTPSSKKLKAGYTHTHGDRPKTPGKIQVGYTGK